MHLSHRDAAEEHVRLLVLALTVHGWDLATALGGPADLANQQVWAATRQFAKPVPVPGDADATTRLVALLGRRP